MKFKINLLYLLLAVALMVPNAGLTAQAAGPVTQDIIVKFKTSAVDLNDLSQRFVVYSYEPLFDQAGRTQYYRLKVSSADTERLNQQDFIDWLETDQKIEAAREANDEFFTTSEANLDDQWYLPKIKAPAAWDIRAEAPQIIVAVIDTGINAKHQDLADGRVISGQKLYCEVVGETSCLKTVRGDIAGGVNSDDNGHGTAVSSLVGAIGNNRLGIVGTAWEVKLMPVKVLNKNGTGTTSDVAEGIVWAAQHGADIINLSLGGATLADSEIITTAVKLATSEGSLVIAAAGNDRSAIGVDLDIEPASPICSEGDSNLILGVAATDSTDRRAAFSNYGTRCIDVSAPGVRVLTAFYDTANPDKNNIYAYRSGTSFSTALASGAAALVKAHFPELVPTQVLSKLKETADPIDDLNTNNCGGESCAGQLGAGRLNLLKALGGFDQPEEPTVPTTTPTNPTTTPPTTPTTTPSLPLPAEGSLVKGDAQLTAYVIKNGFKRPLNFISFVLNGFSFNNIKTLPQSQINEIPTGPLFPPPDNKLIKASQSSAVYVTKNGELRPLTLFSFLSHGFSFANLNVFDQSLVNQLEIGTVLPPPDGTILKANTDPTVYLVENSELHALSLQAFNSRNLQWGNLKVRPISEINLYPKGQPYLQ